MKKSITNLRHDAHSHRNCLATTREEENQLLYIKEHSGKYRTWGIPLQVMAFQVIRLILPLKKYNIRKAKKI